MPDIFGREPQDYNLVRDLQESENWEAYQSQQAEIRSTSTPTHDFNALEAGVPPEFQRATEDAQAVGFLTNNMLAIQTMIDEIMYTAYRLPNYIYLNTSIPDGARTYGVRVLNRVGRSQRITAPGFDAPSATVSESLVTQIIHWYGLDAEWSVDELRGAMMAGIPLDTASVEAAVTGSLETMEAVGLTGGGYEEKGLLNLPTTGANKVILTTLADDNTFAELTSIEIRDLINGELSKMIENSKETLGRNINTGATVYLPGTQYDLLTTKYIGDNAEKTLMKSIKEDNPWTHFAGTPLMIERVLELAGAGASDADRMVVALKHERVAEMGISISPRVLRIMDKGRVICAQVESKFSPLFVKRPSTIYYTDKI